MSRCATFAFEPSSKSPLSGFYRSRVAIVALDGTRTRSQRFLDLEVFRTREQASERATTGAMAWIDANAGKEPLALPTNFSSLD